MKNQIERREFLKNLGFKGAALMAVYCAGTGLSACKDGGEETTPSTTFTPFTVDLENSANAALRANGGYIIKNDVVIARTSTGTYAAVSILCKHENLKQVVFAKSNEFECTAHGARYDVAGKGLNSLGNKGLTSYPVSEIVVGKTLKIG